MFQWFYWHALLPGREIPGVPGDMPTSGKQTTSTHNEED
jgi:sulfide:quinone oxidoreductase